MHISIHGFDTLTIVDRCWLHRTVWFETVEGLANACSSFFLQKVTTSIYLSKVKWGCAVSWQSSLFCLVFQILALAYTCY